MSGGVLGICSSLTPPLQSKTVKRLVNAGVKGLRPTRLHPHMTNKEVTSMAFEMFLIGRRL